MLQSVYLFLPGIAALVSVICGVECVTSREAEGSRIAVIPFVEHHLAAVGYHGISRRAKQVHGFQLQEPVAYVLGHSHIHLPGRLHGDYIHIAGCVPDDISIDRQVLAYLYVVVEIEEQYGITPPRSPSAPTPTRRRRTRSSATCCGPSPTRRAACWPTCTSIASTRAASPLYGTSGEGGLTNVDMSKYDLRYTVAIFKKGATTPLAKQVVTSGDKNSKTFNFRLANNANYKIVAWADFVTKGKKDDLHWNTANLANIIDKDYAGGAGLNDESRDVYWVQQDFTVGSTTLSK